MRKTDVAAAQRRKTALQMRVEGASLEVIGHALGVTKQRAHQIIKSELEAAAGETRAEAQHALSIDLRRVDFVLESMAPVVQGGDPKAAATYLKALERRARYLGLDKPERHEVATVGASDPSTIHARLGAIAARAAGAGTAGAAGDPDPGAAGDPRPGG